MFRRSRFQNIKRDRADLTRFWPEARRGRSPTGGGRGPTNIGGGRLGGWWRYSSLWLGAIFVGLIVGVGPDWARTKRAESQALIYGGAGVRTSFGMCHIGGGTNCVVDGDTLYLNGVKIRVADIDAPETHDYRCPSEKALGDRATRRLQQLVNAGTVTLSSSGRDEDRYGRKLRIVKVDGRSVGTTLVSDGLARWYRGGRKSWC